MILDAAPEEANSKSPVEISEDSPADTPAIPIGSFCAASIDYCVATFGTDIKKGLSERQVVLNRATFGTNVLPSLEVDSFLSIIFDQLKEPLNAVLLFCNVFGCVMDVYNEPGDVSGPILRSIVLSITVCLGIIIGSIMDYDQQCVEAELAKPKFASIEVVRGGVLGAVDSERVVIGDLVPIRHEVKTCCDLLVVETSGLHVSEQMFTGESDPKEKRAIRDGLPSDTSIRRHENVVYDGTIPSGARNKILGYGIVIGVGKNTVMGSKLMSFREEKSVSPLAAKIDQVSTLAMWFSLIVSVVILGMSIAAIFDFDGKGESGASDDPANAAVTKNSLVVLAFMSSLSIFGLGVPEPLAGLSKACSMVASKLMRKAGVVVRNMKDALDLGYAAVICFDKTGTVTTNRMRVVSALIPDEHGGVSESEAPTDALARACVACTEAEVDGDEITYGKQTDAAALIFGNTWFSGPLAVTEKIPFNSRDKFSGCRCEEHYIRKGAYKIMLALCDTVLCPDGSTAPINKTAVVRECETLAREGKRVMAFARSEDSEHWTLLGVIGIEDPPLEEAPWAMKQLMGAQIKLAMITGDTVLTAVAICTKIGVSPHTVLVGKEVKELVAQRSLADFLAENEGPYCFAETDPKDKRDIVEAFKVNDVTCMVGDNGNDADALMCANVGIAVGEADDFVLAAAKVHAKGGWRGIVEGINIARAAVETVGLAGLMLFDNIGILITYVIGLYKFGAQFTIFPIFMALMNFLVDGIPTYLLPMNPMSKALMSRPPPAKNAPLINEEDVPRYMTNILVIVAGSLRAYSTYGSVLDSCTVPSGPETLMLTFQVMNKLAHLISNVSRTETVLEVSPLRNPYLVAGVALNVALYLISMFWAPISPYMGLAPLGSAAWIHIGYGTVISFAIDQSMKVVMRSISSQKVTMCVIAVAVAACVCVASEWAGM